MSPVEINEKKKIIIMKKKLCRIVFGLLPKLYCENKIFVLQPWFCIARERVEKKKKSKKIGQNFGKMKISKIKFLMIKIF